MRNCISSQLRRMTMACKAKEHGKVAYRGKPSIEWYKDGKPQYYCYGYIDKMTDELLPECQECSSHVYKEQDDFDEYRRRSGEEDKHETD
jgi:hypothetical protein